MKLGFNLDKQPYKSLIHFVVGRAWIIASLGCFVRVTNERARLNTNPSYAYYFRTNTFFKND